LEPQKKRFKNPVIIFTRYFTNTFLLTDSYGNKNAIKKKKKKKPLFQVKLESEYARHPGEIFGLLAPS
jgi:hypothetical protein